MIYRWYINDMTHTIGPDCAFSREIELFELTRLAFLTHMIHMIAFCDSHDWPFWLTWFIFETRDSDLFSFRKCLLHCMAAERRLPQLDQETKLRQSFGNHKWIRWHDWFERTAIGSVDSKRFHDVRHGEILQWCFWQRNMFNAIRLHTFSGTAACINDTSPIQPPLPYSSVPSPSPRLRRFRENVKTLDRWNNYITLVDLLHLSLMHKNITGFDTTNMPHWVHAK